MIGLCAKWSGGVYACMRGGVVTTLSECVGGGMSHEYVGPSVRARLSSAGFSN